MKPVFDRDGLIVAWLEDGGSLYDAVGMPIAYLDRDRLYSYQGAFLGWHIDGWFHDQKGLAAGFLEDASGGPARPTISTHRPHAPSTFVRPAKSPPRAAPTTPPAATTWTSWQAMLG